MIIRVMRQNKALYKHLLAFCLMAKETPRKSPLGGRLKAVRSVIASHEIPYLQMMAVTSYNMLRREIDGKK